MFYVDIFAGTPSWKFLAIVALPETYYLTDFTYHWGIA